MSAPAIQPVFVLGSARNGTTLLGNLLSAHPAIAGVEHRAHWGQIESHVYAVQRWAGELPALVGEPLPAGIPEFGICRVSSGSGAEGFQNATHLA